jgi:hypothetical protein
MRPFARTSLAVVALLSPIVALASDQANPAEFPITIHVVSSWSRVANGNDYSGQFLETTIDNHPVELNCDSLGVLALGDYHARLSTKIHAPSKNPNSYDLYRGYDLLMPDGIVRTCQVTGLGPGPAVNP